MIFINMLQNIGTEMVSFVEIFRTIMKTKTTAKIERKFDNHFAISLHAVNRKIDK